MDTHKGGASVGASMMRALREHYLAIGIIAVACGSAAWAVLWRQTPHVEVVAYAEIARNYQVEGDGALREELAVPALVLAGQINSGGYFGQGKRRIAARVPTKTEDLELTVRADSAEEGIGLIRDLVARVSVEHREKQKVFFQRLKARSGVLGAEIDRVRQTEGEFDRELQAMSRQGSGRDALRYFLMTSLRLQMNKDLREFERLRSNVEDAIKLMEERQTRLIGTQVIRDASVLPGALVGLFAAFLGAVVAAALFAARDRRSARRAA